MMKPSEIVNVRYMVDDVDKAIAFYTKLLDFEVLTSFPPAFADVKRGNLRLLLSGPTSSAGRPMPDGAKPGPGGWNRIHLLVDDIESRSRSTARRRRCSSATTSSRDRAANRSCCRTLPATSSSCSNRPHDMSPYSVAVFLHVVGALGLFAALGLEWAGVRNLRRSVTTSQAREWMKLLRGLAVGGRTVVAGPAGHRHLRERHDRRRTTLDRPRTSGSVGDRGAGWAAHRPPSSQGRPRAPRARRTGDTGTRAPAG